MKSYLLFVTTLLFFLLLSVLPVKSQKFYVGTFTSEGAEGIYLCGFNTETGDVELEKTFKAVDNPSFLRLSPNKKFLYVASRTTPEVEKSGGYVMAYKVRENGELEFLNKQVSNGRGPCHVDVSPNGRNVAIANYGGGSISLFPVLDDGCLDSCRRVIKNTGSGPDKIRQKQPHAHSIKFSPYNNQVFSADLGTDQLNIYQLGNYNLKSNGQYFVKIPPGAGPRHFEFHPSEEVIYVINELNSTITAVKCTNNDWKVFQNVSTLPDRFNGESYCADIHISRDGKYLYGSNRGHNSIAVFEVKPEDQSLDLVDVVSVEGNWPRNFALSPDSKWMLVANQKSGDITVFKIDKITGMPEYTGKKIELPAPVCIEFL